MTTGNICLRNVLQTLSGEAYSESEGKAWFRVKGLGLRALGFGFRV